jgi:hypothetical protein
MSEPSSKTSAKLAQRWPRGAEGQRRGIREAADDVREILTEARGAVDDNNPILVRAYLAMIEARVADIQRLAVEARIGPEPTE